eukprot:2703345-Alexandrium_andersonii.AAC.1
MALVALHNLVLAQAPAKGLVEAVMGELDVGADCCTLLHRQMPDLRAKAEHALVEGGCRDTCIPGHSKHAGSVLC